jgi:peptidoglycan lytic transglycosylase
VVITDRGPFNRGRVLDLSLAAAKQLRIVDRGLARVTASVAGR